ncbi:MAG: hypothetical protein ACRD93_04430 [Nitrososphaeraceae archaeon]|jgi:hypothetical protein
MAYFCKDILINDICSILSMINIGYEQNIAILLPIIVTLNTVFVSGFIDLDSTAMIISNSINLSEERRTKSSRLPSSHWCRKCSSDSFYLEDTIEVTPTSSKPTLCEIYVCDSCGQKIEYWKYFEESRTP